MQLKSHLYCFHLNLCVRLQANECANELKGNGHTNKTPHKIFHNNVSLLKLNHFCIEYFILKAEFPQHNNW